MGTLPPKPFATVERIDGIDRHRCLACVDKPRTRGAEREFVRLRHLPSPEPARAKIARGQFPSTLSPHPYTHYKQP